MFFTRSRKANTVSYIEPERFSANIPHHSFDQGSELFFSETTDTAMVIFETVPMPYPIPGFIETLRDLMTEEWPADSWMQFTTYGDPNIEPQLMRYMSLRGSKYDHIGDPSREFLFKASEDICTFAREHIYEGVHGDVPVPFRNFRTFICVKVPCTINEFHGMRGDALAKLKSAKEAIIGILKASGVPFEVMRPNRLITLLRGLFNPGRPVEHAVWDESKAIREQIIEPETIIREPSISYLKAGKWYVQTKTPRDYCENPTALTINKLLGELGAANTRQYPCPFLLNCYIDLANTNASLTGKASFVLAQKVGQRTLGAKARQRHDDLERALKDITTKNEVYLRGMITLTLMAPSLKRLKNAAKMTQAIWKDCLFVDQNEVLLNSMLYLASAPGGVLPSLRFLRSKSRSAPARTWAMLAALQGDSKGTRTPSYLVYTRRGQLATYSLLDSDSNYNGLIFAPSGSGKSFKMNYLIFQTLSMGGRAFVIDIGRSYKMLAEMMDGQIIEFKHDSNISLNLFELITYERLQEEALPEDRELTQEEQITSLKSMLHRLLCQMASPKEVITDNDSSILENTLDHIIRKLKPGECLSMDKIVDHLRDKDLEMVRNNRSVQNYYFLAERLQKYTSSGKYGRWFTGKPNVQFDKNLVILELEELKAEPELREVVLLLIMAIIDQTLYIANDRSQHTLIVLDEAWDLISGANAAPFIETGYRRARKYLGSYITITQSKLDFEKYPALGQAIINNSAFTFYLSHKREIIDDMVAKNLLSLDEYDLELFRSIHTNHGKYSEVGIHFPNGVFSVFRVIVPKEIALVFTTDPLERRSIDNLRELGLTLHQAIKRAIGLIPLQKDHNLDFFEAYRVSLPAEKMEIYDQYLSSGHSKKEAARMVA